MKFVAVASLVLLTVFCVNSLKVTEYGNVGSYELVLVRNAVADPKGEIQSITVATPRKVYKINFKQLQLNKRNCFSAKLRSTTNLCRKAPQSQ